MITTNPEKKESIIKTLAITGLFGLTILIAWLAIQIVQVFPTALSSLASIANSVYNYNPLKSQELDIKTSAAAVKRDEPVTVSWTRPHASGTYVFSYECSSGISLDLAAKGKTFSDLSCEEQYDLGNVDAVDVTAQTNSPESGFFTYMISFYRPNSQTPAASKSVTVTLLADDLAIEKSPDQVIVNKPETATTTTNAAVKTPAPTKSATKTAAISKPGVAVPNFTYEIPVSKPHGTTDLVVSITDLKQLTSTGNYISVTKLKASDAGALEFAVHNIGNHTSDTWTYNVVLPSGEIYESEAEVALLPNERAVITVSFPAVKKTTDKTVKVSVSVTTKRDTNLGTNTTSLAIDIHN